MAASTYGSEMQSISQNQNTSQAATQQQQQQVQPATQISTADIKQQSQTATVIQPSQNNNAHQYIVTNVAVTGDPVAEVVQDMQQAGNGTNNQQYIQYVQDGTATSDGITYSNMQNGQMQNYDYNTQNMMYTPVSATYYHTSAATAAQVQWLIDNYETAEGVSLPRSTLYNHYLYHCHEQKIDPMNPASFGKLIRSVFLGLRTRRLGTRGNSKYHYYGIRIKASSALNQFQDEQTMAMRQTPFTQGKRYRPHSQDGMNSDSNQSNVSGDQHNHMHYLGDASGAIPNFESIEMMDTPLPAGITEENLNSFEELYKQHCEAILDVVVNLQFSLIENLWQTFWRNPRPDGQNIDTQVELENELSKEHLFVMCQLGPVQEYVKQSDYAFYQALVEVLIPDVLRPIPSSLTQAIRNFAKSLEGWLKSSMSNSGVPDSMVKIKVSAVSAFAQTLRRYTSLNHLAQAARAVLQNTAQITQMLTDLNRVDFVNVQEQASWVCQCDDTVVHQLEQDFKRTLQQQNNLEQWSVWLEGVVNRVLKPHEGTETFPKAARQFLLKWSFYSSMVIRDLTLRSAASFGSFHLIRLLYDEYMFYLVEHKVAAATGETPIAVMGEFIDISNPVSLEAIEGKTEEERGINESQQTQEHSTAINQNAPSITDSKPPQSLLLNKVDHNLPQNNGHLITSVTTESLSSTVNTQTRNAVIATRSVPGNQLQQSAVAKEGHYSVQSIGKGVAQPVTINTTNGSVTLVAAPTTNSTGGKTIVVVPVSAGAGDSPIVKRARLA